MCMYVYIYTLEVEDYKNTIRHFWMIKIPYLKE